MPVLDQAAKSSWWQRLGPKRQQKVVIGGAIGAFLLLGYFFLSGGQNTAPPKKPTDNISTLITNADTQALGLTGLNRRMDSSNAELANVQRQLREMQNKEAANKAGAPRTSAGGNNGMTDQEQRQAKEIEQLKKQVEEERNKHAAPPPGTIGGQPAQQQMGQQGVAQGKESYPRIKTIDTDATPPATAEKPKPVAEKTEKPKPAEAYIPSGSMLSGVLLTGVDAPTGRGSNADPIPVLVRIKHEAILPNRYRADVRECFIVGSAYGDLSSERAYARGETLSCVRTDGKVIDTQVKMWLVGEDGKAGIRGHLVSKQGQAIAKAAVAGFAQAYANALQPNVNVIGGAGMSGNTPLSTQALQGATYGGASSALDRIAKFEIDLANQMFPVVEIDAGRPVSFIVLKGSSLPLTAASR